MSIPLAGGIAACYCVTAQNWRRPHPPFSGFDDRPASSAFPGALAPAAPRNGRTWTHAETRVNMHLRRPAPAEASAGRADARPSVLAPGCRACVLRCCSGFVVPTGRLIYEIDPTNATDAFTPARTPPRQPLPVELSPRTSLALLPSAQLGAALREGLTQGDRITAALFPELEDTHRCYLRDDLGLVIFAPGGSHLDRHASKLPVNACRRGFAVRGPCAQSGRPGVGVSAEEAASAGGWNWGIRMEYRVGC